MTLKQKYTVTFSIFICTVFSQLAQAQNWPQWRGPNRDSFLHDFVIPRSWPDTLLPAWRVTVGEGYASPVAEAGRAYILTRQGELEFVTCVDWKNGEIIWQKNYPAPFNTNQYATKFGKGPFSTPALSDGRLYVLGVGGILTCFNTKNGEIVWQHKFTDGPPDSKQFFSGSSMSPLIDENMCIAHIGDDSRGALTAFDKNTGKEIWKWEGDNPGYASPIVTEIAGVKQIVTLTQHNVVGVDLSKGELLWKIPFLSDWRENMPTPVVYQEMVIYSGVGRGVTAIIPKRSGSSWTTEQKWHTDEVAMYMNSPVLSGDLLFGLSHKNKGQFFCLEAATGTIRWLSDGRQGFNASIIKGGDFLFSLTTNSEFIVFKESAEFFVEITRYRVADTETWATPVIFDGMLLIKDKKDLVLLDMASSR